MLYKVILLQVLFSLSVAALFAWWRGADSFISAMLGGSVLWLPSFFLLGQIVCIRWWNLGATYRLPQETGYLSARAATSALFFMMGEVFRVLLSLLMLVAITLMYQPLDWLALMVTLIAAALGNLLSLALRQDPIVPTATNCKA